MNLPCNSRMKQINEINNLKRPDYALSSTFLLKYVNIKIINLKHGW